MGKMLIRKGDRVKVLRGVAEGKEGTVIRVDREKNRVVVEGLNLRKRHRKPSAVDPEGGIITFEAPIDASNVMLLDPVDGKPTRVRAQKNQRGEVERVAVRSGKVIPRA